MRFVKGAFVAVLAGVACGGGLPSLDTSEAGPSDAAPEAHVDAPIDSPKAACNPASPFGAPVRVPTNNDVGFEYAPALSANELTMYWTSTGSDASTQVHIFVGGRTSTSASFAGASLIGINGATNDSDPILSADGLTLYFQTDRDDLKGDIYVSQRASVLSDFTIASPAAGVNDPSYDDTQPALDADGSLWFASDRLGTGTLDLFHASPAGDAGFVTPAEAAELDSSADDWSPTLSADGLKIFFASKRTGGAGGDDIYVATRSTVASAFSAPVAVTELDTKDNELPHWVSTDGCRLYLARNSGVSYSLYVATRSP